MSFARRIFASVVLAASAVMVSSGEAGADSGDPDAVHAAVSALVEANSALGVYADGQAFVVVLPASGPGSAATEEDFRVPGARIRLTRSALTHDQVDAALADVERRAWHAEAGRYSYGFYFDAETATVAVGTDAPPEVIAPVLRAHPGVITYRQADTGRDSRQNDAAPHWGGAAITDGVNACSAGFTVLNAANVRFMVTAGHCFAVGKAITSPVNAHSWGTVKFREPLPTFDMELLGGSTYTNNVYKGDTVGTQTRVKGAADPGLNYTGYCRSGIMTGERCGNKVTSLTATLCDPANTCTKNLIAYSGGTASIKGDSGAPFYAYHPDGTGILIRGLHIGHSGATMFAHRWTTVAGRFGATIAVS
ncbi:hypothetical protein [Actinokineospora globicatena]|uniref:Streptogrisin C n=1 Tax=Actinokineospora globicatena TaxID=103729 RepID=A0A9W6V586_9PSEU|nr:hypothetical protein [Actinokineospora globicatena]GLW90065.1 hypothetical protein Aglo03_08810 [Actinokineospora globicatena]